MPLRVLIDGIAYGNSTQRGIQRYFQETFSRLGRTEQVDLWLRQGVHGELPQHCRALEPRTGYYPRRRDLWGCVQAARLWRRCRRDFGKYDIFHSMFYTRPLVPGPAEVVTVYDMIPERLPGLCYWTGCVEDVEEKRKAIASAAVCLAISEATAAEVRAFYPEAAGKVRVIYPGADHLVRRGGTGVKVGESAGRLCADEYVLFVGDRQGYKNFDRVLEALLDPHWPPGVLLVLVGRAWALQEALLVKRLGLSTRVRHLGVVTDEQLRRAYREARCFVFPSLGEGFGFPLLEAQSMGCAVACSDIPVFRETAGDSAEYFDPHAAASLAGAVARLMDDGVRAEQRRRHAANVARFSWDRCASQTLEAYREVAARM